jgi:hypothetical protein
VTSAQPGARASAGTGSLSSSWGTGRKSVISGSVTGSMSSGSAIGRVPGFGSASSYTMGNGSPQYRCRENSQSFRW